MKHRIRAAGLVVDGDHILLVRHRHNGVEWWGPPGGGFEGEDGSTVETVRRELLEESGLEVNVGELVFVREFYEKFSHTYHVELFYRITGWSGEVTTDNLQGAGDEHIVQSVEWVHRERLPQLKLYPVELCDLLWQVLQQPPQGAIHLGSFS